MDKQTAVEWYANRIGEILGDIDSEILGLMLGLRDSDIDGLIDGEKDDISKVTFQ